MALYVCYLVQPLSSMQQSILAGICQVTKNEPEQHWLQGLPNRLTLFRIAVVPVLLILFPFNVHFLRLLCAFLFMVASLTDWADGFIARRFNMESKFGAIIDPIADKTLMGAAIVLVAASGSLWAWMAGMLLCRELAVSGLRLVALQQGISLPVTMLAKWKTLFLDVALVCLMVDSPLFGWPWREVGMVSVWLALATSYYSGWMYVQTFWEKTKI